MIFLTILFYSFSIFAIRMDLSTYFHTEQWVELKAKVKSDDKTKPLEMDVLIRMIGAFCYTVWAITGLFSSQWFLFLALILTSMIPKKENIIALKIDALVSVFLVIAIIINKFHLGYVIKL